MPTVEDCVRFIRERGVLSDWKDVQIIDQIIDSIHCHSMAFGLDKNNKLISICLARWHGNCCMHIIAIAGDKGELKALYKHLRKQFPQVNKLTADRKGKYVEYNITNFKGMK